MISDKHTTETDGSDSLLPSLDLTAIIADFRRFSRFFAVIFGCVFLLIIVPVLMQVPTYTATASVMMDPRTLNATPNQDVLSDLPPDAVTVDTEVEILKSNALGDRVLRSLQLDQDPEFNPALNSSHFFGLIKNKPDNRRLTPLEAQGRHEAVLNNVLGHLTVARSGATRIITISFTSTSPEKAARIANEWARLYLSQQLETKFQATKEANDWLNSRLGDLRTQVEAAETAVQQYKIAHNLLAVSPDNTLGQQQITTLDQQLAGVKVDRAESEARLAVARRQLTAGSGGEDVGEALNSDVVKNLRAQRTTVSQRLADLQSRYGSKHPDIIKAQDQLNDIDAQIRAEIQRIMSNLEAQAEIQRQRTASLAGSVAQARGQLVGNNQAMVKLNELQRNADAVSTLYQSYLDRFKQTSSQEGIDRSDARIVSNAALPTGPSAPKIPLSMALAFIGALGAATGSVLIRRALDSGLTTATDVETILRQPHLGNVADLASTLTRGQKATPAQYVVDKPLSVFSEGFRIMRAALIYSRIGHDVKVIAVTSSLPGEGKTTTSVCLARVMALSGQSVVVVDCDLRRRSINQYITGPVEGGFLKFWPARQN
ncbi:MAG: exopolysaccharide transport family protein [Asticcacaulis sp.]|nr:exopolysaccharide transport family protein [Asticcacaulis sp.]